VTGPGGPSCVICRIACGDEASSLAYQDEDLVAFMDLYPVTPGHTLIAPRIHVPSLSELDERVGALMWRLGHRIAKELRSTSVRCEGVNLLLADGEAAFQEIPHCHLHVFPRYPGDSFKIDADWHQADRADLDRVAQELATRLQAIV
jgi:diadenosine tetraphosphate (Ap4A) HIT family hydrolase